MSSEPDRQEIWGIFCKIRKVKGERITTHRMGPIPSFWGLGTPPRPLCVGVRSSGRVPPEVPSLRPPEGPRPALLRSPRT
jgi:hypothetical protein